MPINKLEQLRKYIINIEIERIRFGQVFNSKGNFVGIDKTLSIQSVSRGINHSYDSLIERNHKRGMLLPFCWKD